MQTNICQAHKQNNVVRESKLSLILVNLKQQILTPPRKKRRWLQNKTKENKAQPHWPEVSSQKRRIRK